MAGEGRNVNSGQRAGSSSPGAVLCPFPESGRAGVHRGGEGEENKSDGSVSSKEKQLICHRCEGSGCFGRA